MRRLSNARQLSVVLVGLLVIGLVPLAPVTAHTSCQGMAETGHITLSSPLAEEVSASQISYMLLRGGMAHAFRHVANGVDSLTIDLHCAYVGADFVLRGTDHGNGMYDLSITFMDDAFVPLGTFTDLDSPDVSGYVPDQSHYAMVTLLDGVPIAGFTPVPPKPYSAAITLTLRT